MAALTALCGYQYSLDYARERPQGRLPSTKDPLSPPASLIEHADVRRMLLAQKAYAEGAYALCLLGSCLADDARTAPTQVARVAAHQLLDFLTPIIKSWPSEYGPKANSLAIQVMGGAGYVNENPVETMYRDNRLNPIHEGTTGIQSIDLLGRKVSQNNGSGYLACLAEIRKAIVLADAVPALSGYADELQAAVDTLESVTKHLLKAIDTANIDLVMANSVRYLELFGSVVIAWMWLKQGFVAQQGLDAAPHIEDENFYLGKLHAMRYFFRFELPEIENWAKLLLALDDTTYTMAPEWF